MELRECWLSVMSNRRVSVFKTFTCNTRRIIQSVDFGHLHTFNTASSYTIIFIVLLSLILTYLPTQIVMQHALASLLVLRSEESNRSGTMSTVRAGSHSLCSNLQTSEVWAVPPLAMWKILLEFMPVGMQGGTHEARAGVGPSVTYGRRYGAVDHSLL